eukprot:765486-Hanusia_phi.AAC.2
MMVKRGDRGDRGRRVTKTGSSSGEEMVYSLQTLQRQKIGQWDELQEHKSNRRYNKEFCKPKERCNLDLPEKPDSVFGVDAEIQNKASNLNLFGIFTYLSCHTEHKIENNACKNQQINGPDIGISAQFASSFVVARAPSLHGREVPGQGLNSSLPRASCVWSPCVGLLVGEQERVWDQQRRAFMIHTPVIHQEAASPMDHSPCLQHVVLGPKPLDHVLHQPIPALHHDPTPAALALHGR